MNKGFTLLEIIISFSIAIIVVFPFISTLVGMKNITLYGRDRIETIQNIRIANHIIRQDIHSMKLNSIREGRMGSYRGIWGKNSDQVVVGYYFSPSRKNLYRYIAVPINKNSLKENEFPDRHPFKFRRPTSNPLVQNVMEFNYLRNNESVTFELKLKIGRRENNINIICLPRL
ncbi:MAG: hypothetical protein DDT42_00060 [candidate division WS2 bacterium]|uniref:Prepilin-type N-terminal cleavage/methylation domain-containing protein n=1 Tax=Psychracetigena formicireducens TaxID=2986056 RepID=A0A9E2BEP4_PSYF1|nr:hypothetical protein [Candidatus Psychracetigena formicireducens]MBT9144228.1 hypothetical protein [Candidatus Psychracetigena formicireducens]